MPQHIPAPRRAVEHAPEHEQQIRETIEILARAVVDSFGLRQRHQRTFGAAADGAGMVGARGGAGAAGEDEILERFQIGVVVVDGFFQLFHLLRGHHAHAGNADFATQVEQIVLHAGEERADIGRQFFREQQTNRGVGLVDFANRVDARIAFRDAAAVAQACLTSIAGAGVDLRDAMSHMFRWWQFLVDGRA